MSGPIRGIHYIHKAIARELEILEAEAGELDPNNETQLRELADDLDFVHGAVRGHADGEEAVLYPALDRNLEQVSRP